MKYKRRGLHELDLAGVPNPLRPLLRAAIDAGAVVTPTSRGHCKIQCPNGGPVITVSLKRGSAEQEAQRTRSRLARAGIAAD